MKSRFHLIAAASMGLVLGKYGFDAAVHHYILAHPEVLSEMSARLQQRRQAEAS